ncbi:hypothetical protein [Sinomicrobium soli]|uniref:hypothetical protein n=1 Tax=Sinomicrobium sp. N-1-3-6 TaxID=2219864 RepID=UPI000DCB5511|nr:hypothetical protein [Sinomicrobium sp. N-1-3-6]RAV27927.1 hypothetical protein DN748_16110 [Sinomicrobium sp. N-1-3-6]
MKPLFALFALFFIVSPAFARDLEGAWILTHKNGEAVSGTEYIKIYQDGYFAFGGKQVEGNEFTDAGGGIYTLEGDRYSETPDFYTSDTGRIGKKHSSAISFSGDSFTVTAGNGNTETWKRLSATKDDLTRNWVITGRADAAGKVSEMTPGDRRTVKILSGGRFQWIAFNSATREFMGTGGGTYTAENGKYTENITFFSRDNSRVGASLGFEYEVKDGKWHHSGLSSKGDPIYEIWSPYSEAYLAKQ